MVILSLLVAFTFLPGALVFPGRSAQAQAAPWFAVVADPAGTIQFDDFEPGTVVTVHVDGVLRGSFDSDACQQGCEGLSLPVGSLVEVSDGTTTKTHVVTNLEITAVDAVADTVTGRADPGDVIDVWVHEPVPSVQATADGGGVWVADFAGIVDLQPGTNGNSGESDADGDQTWAFWRVPDPRFQVAPLHGMIWAQDFTPDGSIDITIDGTPFGPFPTDGHGNFDGNDFGLTFPVAAGANVTVSDGTTTKTHVVTNLAVTAVDEAADTVTGSADPGDTVAVWEHGTGTHLDVTADGSGVWTADFTGIVDFQPGTEGNSGETDADGDQTTAFWDIPNPRFQVAPLHGMIWAEDFTPDGSIDITIDGTPFGPYPTDGHGNFDGNNFGLRFPVPAGANVTVSDGTTTKTHVVTNLAVTGVDEAADTVTGSADPGDTVAVWEHGTGTHLDVTADGSGVWTADFTGIVDFQPGTEGNSGETDADGDQTWAFWRVPNPRFQVAPLHGMIWAEDFTPDGSIDITIDGTPFGPYPTDGHGNFDGNNFGLRFPVPAGANVTVSDGTTTKTHVVTNLAVTAVDEAADTVTGSADPGDNIAVWEHGTGAHLNVTADGSGVWTADFTGLVDFQPGTNGNSGETDADGDQTTAFWDIPNPRFNVDIAENNLWGHEWPPNTLLSVFVDGVLEDTPVTDGNGDFDTGFDPGVLQLAPGMDVEVTDGVTLKAHAITNLHVTGADADLDTVSGIALNGTDVDVWVHDTNAWRHEVADGSGDWTADFSTPGGEPGEQDTNDLGPGSNGAAAQCDADADCSFAHWQIPNPQFGVGVNTEQVWGGEWPPGTTVSISVDGGLVGTAATDAWGNFHLGFDPPVGLAEGQVVEVTDGTTTKDHTITGIQVTAVDVAADTVTGVAAPGITVNAGIHEHDAPWRATTADGAGVWTVDFANPAPEDGRTFDIVPGTGGWAHEAQDPDGDYTQWDWHLSNPSFQVQPLNDQIHGWDWTPDATVDVSVNGSPIETVPTDGNGNFGTGYDPAVLDLGHGDLVEVTDGPTLKSHVVTPLAVTDIDPATETVVGVGNPGADVFVDIHGQPDVGRTVAADGGGVWTADFSTPGDGGGTWDIEPGTDGYANEQDGDGDQTWVDWRARAPWFGVSTPWDWIEGQDFLPGTVVTIDIDDPDNGPGADFSATAGTDEAGNFNYSLDGAFDVLAGHEVTVSDGTHTKVHVVTDVEVTDVDPVADTVSGLAEPGTEVQVDFDDSLLASVWEHLIFQLDPARFSRNPGSLNEHLEFRQAVAHAIDRDALVAAIPGAGHAIYSHVEAYVPALSGHSWAQYPYDPVLAAQMVSDLCADLDHDCVADPPTAVFTTTSDNPDRVLMASLLEPMLAAAGITMVIDLEPAADFFGDTINNRTFDLGEWAWVHSPDLAGLVSVHDAFDPDEQFHPSFYGWGTPGSSVSNAGTVRYAELVGLMHATGEPALLGAYISEAEQILADQVVFVPLYVRAEPGHAGNPVLYVTAAPDGTWTADFSGYYDIGPGSSGRASQFDDDNDGTRWDFRVPNPHFNVDASNEGVWGHEWPPDSSVELWINGTLIEEPPTDSNGDFGTGFDPGLLDIRSGDLVEVTDGVTLKSHTVTGLTVTEVDADLDVVRGTADPDSDVDIWVHDSEAWRHEVADGSGNWTADFSTAGNEEGEEATEDLGPGRDGNSNQCDDDGDCTFAHWRIASPEFGVGVNTEQIWGGEFLANASVTIWVEGVEIETVPTDGDGNFHTGYDPSFLDLAPGNVVEVSDGMTLKAHTVTGIEVTSIDEAADTVTGIAAPGGPVEVGIHGHDMPFREAVADGGGVWTVDFATPAPEDGRTFDIEPGTDGWAIERDPDPDRDYTQWDWRALLTRFWVNPLSNDVWGADWQPDHEVTIFVNGVEVARVGTSPWGDFGTGFDPAHVDIQPDDLVEVDDGTTFKDTVVTHLAITDVDGANDHVVGKAVPGSEVWVETHTGDHVQRHVSADGAGDWLADFAVPGDEPFEDRIFDLDAGAHGVAEQRDADHDATQLPWEIPGFVEGNVYVDGEPLPGVEVWFSPDRFTCTDPSGYFSFDEAHVGGWGWLAAATGPAYNRDILCPNAAFLAPDGRPLLVELQSDWDMSDGYEYLEFHPERAAATQTVEMRNYDGSWHPVDGAPIAVFDRTDPAFVAEFGSPPDPARYEEIFESGIGQIWWSWTGAIMDWPGSTLARYPAVTDVLVLGEIHLAANGQRLVLGAEVDAGQFVDRGDGLFIGPTVRLQPPAVSVADVSVTEGNAGLTYAVVRFELDQVSPVPVALRFATRDGSAIAGEDYLARGTLLVFQPGQTSRARYVPIIGDVLPEPTEWFELDLWDGDGLVIETDTARVTIHDNDPPVVSVADVELIEGDFDFTMVRVLFELTGEPDVPVSVVFATANGSAQAGSDYAARAGVVSFEPGDTSARRFFRVFGDTTVETDEWFTVNLSAPSGLVIGDASAEVTIRNDDIPVVSVADAEIVEGHSGLSYALVRLELDQPSPVPVSVAFTTNDGTAVAGSDYLTRANTLLFQPGQTARARYVPIIGDTDVEHHEWFAFDLFDPNGLEIATPTALVTILNDDLPVVSVADVEVTEGDGGATWVRVLFELSGPADEPVGVAFATANATAQAGFDYAARSGTVSFEPGDTTARRFFRVFGDTTVEEDEWFTVALSAPAGVVIGDDTAEVMIRNDDHPVVTVADASVWEGDGGLAYAIVNFELDQPSPVPVSVAFATRDGSAIAGSDYLARAATLVFNPGQVRRARYVPVIGDVDVEYDEWFAVDLFDPNGVAIGSSSAPVTVMTDDPVVRNPNLIALWQMDEGAGRVVGDSGPNDIDGVRFGAAWVPGRSGTALEFDGVDDYVRVAPTPEIYPTEAVTVEAWIRPATAGGTASNIVLNGRAEGITWGFHLALTADNRVDFSAFASAIWHEYSTTVLEPGRWYHVVGTYENRGNSGPVAVYVDGVLEAHEALRIDGPMRVSNRPLTIGAVFYFSDLRAEYQGAIDGLAIYDRALTAEEVAEHYAAGLP